jgi:hypothetical protein
MLDSPMGFPTPRNHDENRHLFFIPMIPNDRIPWDGLTGIYWDYNADCWDFSASESHRITMGDGITSDTFTSFSTAQDLRVLRQARENVELQHPALSQPEMKKVDASQQLAGGFKTFSNMWSLFFNHAYFRSP